MLLRTMLQSFALSEIAAQMGKKTYFVSKIPNINKRCVPGNTLPGFFFGLFVRIAGFY